MRLPDCCCLRGGLAASAAASRRLHGQCMALLLALDGMSKQTSFVLVPPCSGWLDFLAEMQQQMGQVGAAGAMWLAAGAAWRQHGGSLSVLRGGCMGMALNILSAGAARHCRGGGSCLAFSLPSPPTCPAGCSPHLPNRPLPPAGPSSGARRDCPAERAGQAAGGGQLGRQGQQQRRQRRRQQRERSWGQQQRRLQRRPRTAAAAGSGCNDEGGAAAWHGDQPRRPPLQLLPGHQLRLCRWGGAGRAALRRRGQVHTRAGRRRCKRAGMLSCSGVRVLH